MSVASGKGKRWNFAAYVSGVLLEKAKELKTAAGNMDGMAEGMAEGRSIKAAVSSYAEYVAWSELDAIMTMGGTIDEGFEALAGPGGNSTPPSEADDVVLWMWEQELNRARREIGFEILDILDGEDNG